MAGLMAYSFFKQFSCRVQNLLSQVCKYITPVWCLHISLVKFKTEKKFLFCSWWSCAVGRSIHVSVVYKNVTSVVPEPWLFLLIFSFTIRVFWIKLSSLNSLFTLNDQTTLYLQTSFSIRNSEVFKWKRKNSFLIKVISGLVSTYLHDLQCPLLIVEQRNHFLVCHTHAGTL